MRTLLISLALISSIYSFAHAEGCDDYPFTQGISVEAVNGGTRIIATSAVSVSFDDVDSLKDARDEATLEAKSLISAFMSEGIKSEQDISKVVNETKSMQGDDKLTTRKEVIERLKRLSSSSQAMLRGVVPLGECYTKAKEFRASVGIKPETISAAEGAAGTVAASLAKLPTANTLSTGTTEPTSGSPAVRKTQGIRSYSNTEELNKF